MKNLMVIILMVVGLSSTIAQQETVFSKFRNWGAFGSFNYEYGLKQNRLTSTAGGGFGLVVGTVFIGGYGNSSGNLDNVIQDDPYFDLAHGGLWLGYTPMSKKLFHPIVSLRLGTGAADIKSNRPRKKDYVSVITPEVGVELNITKIFRLAVTGNYRFVNGIEASNPRTNKDYEGLNIAVGLRIGWFGRWRNNSCKKGKSRISIDISDDDDEINDESIDDEDTNRLNRIKNTENQKNDSENHKNDSENNSNESGDLNEDK